MTAQRRWANTECCRCNDSTGRHANTYNISHIQFNINIIFSNAHKFLNLRMVFDLFNLAPAVVPTNTIFVIYFRRFIDLVWKLNMFSVSCTNKYAIIHRCATWKSQTENESQLNANQTDHKYVNARRTEVSYVLWINTKNTHMQWHVSLRFPLEETCYHFSSFHFCCHYTAVDLREISQRIQRHKV